MAENMNLGLGYTPEYDPMKVKDLYGQYNQTFTDPNQIAGQVSQYSRLLEPGYNESIARLKNALASSGTLHGSPLSYGMGQLESSRQGQIGQYGLGLLGQGQQNAYNTLSNALGAVAPARSLEQQGIQFGQNLTEQKAQREQQQSQFNTEQQRLKDAIIRQQEWEMAQAGGGILGQLLAGRMGGGDLGGIGGGAGGGIGGINLPSVNLNNLLNPNNWTRPGDILGGIGQGLQDTWGNIGNIGGSLLDWITGKPQTQNFTSPATSPAGSLTGVSSATGNQMNIGALPGVAKGLSEYLSAGNIGKGMEAGIPSSILGSAYAINPVLGASMQFLPKISEGLTNLFTGGASGRQNAEERAHTEKQNRIGAINRAISENIKSSGGIAPQELKNDPLYKEAVEDYLNTYSLDPKNAKEGLKSYGIQPDGDGIFQFGVSPSGEPIYRSIYKPTMATYGGQGYIALKALVPKSKLIPKGNLITEF